MYYKIYQIKDISETDYAFRCFDKNKFNFNNYEMVYSDFIKLDTPVNILEDLFFTFNCERPEDFKGHSLSVSDVVSINTPTETGYEIRYYYCNSIEWKDITEYIKK